MCWAVSKQISRESKKKFFWNKILEITIITTFF